MSRINVVARALAARAGWDCAAGLDFATSENPRARGFYEDAKAILEALHPTVYEVRKGDVVVGAPSSLHEAERLAERIEHADRGTGQREPPRVVPVAPSGADMGDAIRAAVTAYLGSHPGATVASLARDAGIAQPNLHRVLRPGAAIRQPTVTALCHALGLRVALVPAE